MIRFWELPGFEHDECVIIRHEQDGARDAIEYHQCRVKVLRFDALPPPRDVESDPAPAGVAVHVYGPDGQWGIAAQNPKLAKGMTRGFKFIVGVPFAPLRWSEIVHW